MNDIRVYLPEGGDVDIDALNYLSCSHLHIEDSATTYTIGDLRTVASRGTVDVYWHDELVWSADTPPRREDVR